MAEEQVKYATIIHDEAERLTRLLGDLLDLSVLENGQVRLNVQQVLLGDVIDRAIAASGSSLKQMKIRRVHVNENVQISTDADRLVQVFINIISNAQKYCTAENPELKIKIKALDEVLHIDFVDNGDGIASANQTVVFEKFSRLTDTVKAGSAGLGLAICREIMTKLNGQIQYVPGQGGAAFRVILPKA